MNYIEHVRHWLRRRPSWLAFQDARREGWIHAGRRIQVQRRILGTPPLRTAQSGSVEVRTLTWRRDWINLLWAVKSFYHYSGVDYPLHIHDGGLTHSGFAGLRRHCPDATFEERQQADERANRMLKERGLERCIQFRKSNASARKLFDFYLFSKADYILTIDSDIVFFRYPDELVRRCVSSPNRYNRDADYAYCMTLDEMEAAFGIRPIPLINSGLALVRRTSIDFELIERLLADRRLSEDRWVSEQTLHALCSAVSGVQLLPNEYCVSTKPGLAPSLVCKHYPGYFRHLLYEEGMAHLVKIGFLENVLGRPQEPFTRFARPEIR